MSVHLTRDCWWLVRCEGQLNTRLSSMSMLQGEKTQKSHLPRMVIEHVTSSLQDRCSTNWATLEAWELSVTCRVIYKCTHTMTSSCYHNRKILLITNENWTPDHFINSAVFSSSTSTNKMRQNPALNRKKTSVINTSVHDNKIPWNLLPKNLNESARLNNKIIKLRFLHSKL